MKVIFIGLIFFPVAVFSQTVFWTETFDNGCTSGCLASSYSGVNGAWSVASNGVNGAAPNKWYVSCAENGTASGSCGAACGNNATLHIGANQNSYCTCLLCADPTGDCGAAYDACALPFFNLCAGSDPTTNTRAISPTISTVGKSGISVSFDYIEGGDGAIDNAISYYSTDNGVTWILLVDMAKTAVCFSGQGRWANYTSGTLPAACDNIATFRISFVWMNNSDDVGNDPSFAGNDLKIRYNVVLPVTFLNVEAVDENGAVMLKWATASEINNDYFTVQRSADAEKFEDIVRVKGAGNSSGEIDYSAYDRKPLRGISYYRIMQTDYDCRTSFSETVAVNNNPLVSNLDMLPDIVEHSSVISFHANGTSSASLSIYDSKLTRVYNEQVAVKAGVNTKNLALENLGSGIYFLILETTDNRVVRKFVKQ